MIAAGKFRVQRDSGEGSEWSDRKMRDVIDNVSHVVI